MDIKNNSNINKDDILITESFDSLIYRSFFENTDAAVMVIELIYDQDGKINDYKHIKVNSLFEKNTGVKNDYLVGKTCKQFYQNHEISYLKDFAEVNQTGKSRQFRAFGKVIKQWFDAYCLPMGNNKLIVRFRNITEKIELEEALRKSEEGYNAFMTVSFDWMYRLSSDFNQTYMMKKYGVLLNTETAKCNIINENIHPDDLMYVLGEIKKAIDNKSFLDLEYCFLNANGSDYSWVRSRVVPITNEVGDIVEWFGASTDISLQKEFNLKLLEKEKEYLEILDSSTLGTFIIDYEKGEIRISEIWKKRLGLDKLDLEEIYAARSGQIHPEDIDRAIMTWKKSINEKESRVVDEYRVKTVDSGYIWVLQQGKINYNEEGNVVKIFGTLIDISNRKMVEESIQKSEKKAKDLIIKLQKSDEQKNNFISTLSHELRNPLAAISMGLSLMDHVSPGSEEDIRARDVIKRQTSQLTMLVNDLLEVTRVNNNKIQLRKEEIEINRIVKDTLEEFHYQFMEKGVAIEGHYYVDSIYIKADPVWIKQVIGNLLFNSLKFTDKGGIVKLKVSKDLDNSEVVIRVSDTGIGLDPELQKELFDTFIQADNSLGRVYGGLGLGLSIVKGIIDLHNGSIVARSEGLGKGTKFIIRLPL